MGALGWCVDRQVSVYTRTGGSVCLLLQVWWAAFVRHAQAGLLVLKLCVAREAGDAGEVTCLHHRDLFDVGELDDEVEVVAVPIT